MINAITIVDFDEPSVSQVRHYPNPNDIKLMYTNDNHIVVQWGGNPPEIIVRNAFLIIEMNTKTSDTFDFATLRIHHAEGGYTLGNTARIYSAKEMLELIVKKL